MKSRNFIFVFLFISVLEAFPTDLETCPRFGQDDDFYSPMYIENRVGFKRGLKRPSKINSKTLEVGESGDDDDEMNGLFNSFWAVDNLPRRSPFVSIRKLPDVYMDQDDQPSPIDDLIPVEQSEITAEARDLREPVFVETQLYNPSLQLLSNGGNQIYNKPIYRQNSAQVNSGNMGLNPYYYNSTQNLQVPTLSNISPKSLGKPQTTTKKTILKIDTTEKVATVKNTIEKVKVDSQTNCTVSDEGHTPATSLEHIEIIPKKNPPKVKPETKTVSSKDTPKKLDDHKKSTVQNTKQDVKP
ncbi:hypothetical protein WA026_012256 [Henosepilachna vigintioctopunctata]|uniref:Uncharacterized protein n=1 Tax=Henosepilachna vigintioctopunctata TaxID=420089 RepID=A0AAW1V6K6_9CUCU